jgi:hypothetical protein
MGSRLESISSSPMLKQYAQGAAQDSIQPVAEFLAPTVPVATSVGRYKQYDEKNRFHLPQTIRGLGGRAVELSFNMTDKTYNCVPHALDFPVDNLEQLEGDLLENILQEGATLIAEVAGLAHEKSVIDAALVAVGAGSSVDWTRAGTGDPVSDIDNAILSVIKIAKYGSLMGVGVLFGATAYMYFKNHPTVRSRFVTAGGNAIPNITPDTASGLFLGNPDTRVSYMVYDSAAEGIAASMNFLLDTSVVIFARKENPTRRDPSFMKTFRLINNFMVPGSYVREDGRAEVAKFDWSEDIHTTNSAAAVRLNPTGP